jgi:excisionase family DNA binding protein
MQAYTVEQVAEILHVGRDKVYYLLRTRQLRSLKIGKLRRITDEQIAAFIASLDDATLRPSEGSRPSLTTVTRSLSPGSRG